MIRGGILLVVMGGLVVGAPFGSVYLAEFIAEANGCRLDVAGVYPCAVMGADIGGLLASMFFAGFYVFFTILPGAALAGVGMLLFIVGLIRRRISRG